MVRAWCALYILTSKCASHHNGVHFFDISTSKSGPSMVLYILTSKCASHHNGVHFFDISTSKSAPSMVCFLHFDFKMCFAPQRRALFRHLNFQKWSEHGVLSCAFYILTSKCASHHNGVHFFHVATLKSALKLRCFVHFDFEMCFAPQRRAIFHLSSGQMAPHPPL